jgi:hypothetical protein
MACWNTDHKTIYKLWALPFRVLPFWVLPFRVLPFWVLPFRVLPFRRPVIYNKQ